MGIQRRPADRRVEVARPINRYFHCLPDKIRKHVEKADDFYVIEDADHFIEFLRELETVNVRYPDTVVFTFPIQGNHLHGVEKAVKSVHSPSHIFCTFTPGFLDSYDHKFFREAFSESFKKIITAIERHPFIDKATDIILLYVFDNKWLLTQTIQPNLYVPCAIMHYWDQGNWWRFKEDGPT